MMIVMAPLAALALAVGSAPSASPPTPATIVYRVGYPPLCAPGGSLCFAYTIILNPDGSGRVLIVRDGSTSAYRFDADEAQATAFRRALARFRPRGLRRLTAEADGCEPLVTDQDTVDIMWERPASRNDRLILYEGCRLEGRSEMIDAVHSAPHLLPIEHLIGRR